MHFPSNPLSLNNIQLSHLINFPVGQLKQTLFSGAKEPLISDALVMKKNKTGNSAQSSF